MRKYFLLAALCVASVASSNAQVVGITNVFSTWEFVNGDITVPASSAIYGIQGLSSQGNKPGSRDGSIKKTIAGQNKAGC